MFNKRISAIKSAFAMLGLVAVAALACAAPARAAAQGIPGAVYVMSNDSSGNSIMAFHRAPDGTLKAAGAFPTGGLGFGTASDPLGSQGSLILSNNGHFLFAVNAGSNDVSVMQVTHAGLSLLSKVPSGGTEPVSLALYKNLLYVLNAGGTPNISGFALDPSGVLHPLAGSSRMLAGGTSAGPAEISFTPDGSFLLVTEKGTNQFDVYQVLSSGLTNGPTSMPSTGTTPFGFAFGGQGALIVSEAFGGGAGMGAASSYHITAAGNLVTVSGSVADTQTAPCWVVTTNNGHFAYLSNTGSGTVSSYRVQPGGSLTLLDAAAGSTGDSSSPTDEALSANSQFFYVLDSGTGDISAFEVGRNGSLTPIAGAGGLPITAQGIAAE
jgi:6-phosphogluconolactonase